MPDIENYNRILLIRALPGSPSGRAALAAAGQDASSDRSATLAFFHGPGVEHAADAAAGEWQDLAQRSGIRLEVCSTAWLRRHHASPPPPFELSTLVRFWHRAVQAAQVDCFGVADGT